MPHLGAGIDTNLEVFAIRADGSKTQRDGASERRTFAVQIVAQGAGCEIEREKATGVALVPLALALLEDASKETGTVTVGMVFFDVDADGFDGGGVTWTGVGREVAGDEGGLGEGWAGVGAGDVVVCRGGLV